MTLEELARPDHKKTGVYMRSHCLPCCECLSINQITEEISIREWCKIETVWCGIITENGGQSLPEMSRKTLRQRHGKSGQITTETKADN